MHRHPPILLYCWLGNTQFWFQFRLPRIPIPRCLYRPSPLDALLHCGTNVPQGIWRWFLYAFYDSLSFGRNGRQRKRDVQWRRSQSSRVSNLRLMHLSQITGMVIHAPHLMVAPPVPVSIVTIERASVVTKAGRLLRALKEFNAQGRPLASKPVRRERLAACAACELYAPEGNWGWGECRAPGCGCTKFKAWLLSEKCPHPNGSRWVDQTNK